MAKHYNGKRTWGILPTVTVVALCAAIVLFAVAAVKLISDKNKSKASLENGPSSSSTAAAGGEQTGKATGTQTSAQTTGTAGVQTGGSSGEKSGTQTSDSQSGTQTGTQTGAQTGSQTGTQTGSQTGSQTGTQTGTQTGGTGTSSGTSAGTSSGGTSAGTSSGTSSGTSVPADADIETLIAGYFYDEAIAKLKTQNTQAAKDRIAEVEKLKSKLIKYSGKVYHVFFHSLIIDTSLAFDNKGHSAEGYNMWMTTVSEFKKMLPLFLENDFVLYDITETCEIKDGKVTEKDIYLPAGKKPLVISIDDVNYYDYMKGDGFAERLDVDSNGNVVTIVNGEATYDGDVMPILDAFVREHPEFSFRGAKGIVATTGYAGAFGYRITDLELYSPADQKYMLDKVTEVANALRATGWQIANHSYTHNQYWNTKSITMTQLKYDTGRWVNEIMPYVGKTNIFISPFGVAFDQNDERYRYLLSLGFNIYCPVGAGMNTHYYSDNMTQERLNLDGYTMIKQPQRVSKYFFDPALVLDPSRPPLN